MDTIVVEWFHLDISFLAGMFTCFVGLKAKGRSGARKSWCR